MIDPALRQKLRRLEIKARHLADSRLMGEWRSNVPGQGLEFRDLRDYVIGDDLRRLDWKATARTGRAQLRQFQEERRQTVRLACDLSASMAGEAKRSLQLELVALLGWAVVLQKDLLDLWGFAGGLEFRRPPLGGEGALWAALQDLAQRAPGTQAAAGANPAPGFKRPAGGPDAAGGPTAGAPSAAAGPGKAPPRAGTDFSALWRQAMQLLVQPTTLIVVTDLWGDLDETRLRGLARRHDLWIFHIAEEPGPEDGGLVCLEDAETGEVRWVDTSARGPAEGGPAGARAWARRLRDLGAWYARFPLGEDPYPRLLEFLRQRSRFVHV